MEYRYKDLILRDFRETDIDSMLYWCAGYHPWMDWDAPWEPVQQVDEEQYRAQSMEFIAAEKTVPRWSLQIEVDGVHIGYVGSYRIGEDYDDVSDEAAASVKWYRAVGMAILNDAYWGKGLGTMALEGWLRYLLENGVEELFLQTWSGNGRMIHVAEKLGFHECSRRVGIREWQGRRYDALTFRLDVPAFLRAQKPRVRWIFFDLGSTLIDETQADLHRIREMTAGTGITEEQYRQKRLELIRQGCPADAAAIACFGLTKTPWHSEDETPYPDAAPALAALKAGGFRLGVIANQNPGTAERLANWNLLQYFDLVVASAEAGAAKPDAAIFRMALDRAGCAPEQAVMAGDRLDNDVAPANRLGMHTVRILRGLGALYSPQSPEEKPENTIRVLEELTALFLPEEETTGENNADAL